MCKDEAEQLFIKRKHYVSNFIVLFINQNQLFYIFIEGNYEKNFVDCGFVGAKCKETHPLT
ncbi:MAG: hypothetical protein NT007_07025, partial [Candidatus Kapabacteria bacterium]|nr:hypothetical protein [Candidatus Kapabacteria bacterium]